MMADRPFALAIVKEAKQQVNKAVDGWRVTGQQTGMCWTTGVGD